MILILTQAGDETAQAVVDRLDAKGKDYVLFETERFCECPLTLEYGVHSPRYSLRISDRRVDLSDVETVWNRRPATPVSCSQLSDEDQDFARRETNHVLKSLWHLLANRFWVNPYALNVAAESKPYQLETAQRVGFHTPRTLITNDGEQALRFFDECNGEMIYKCFSGYWRVEGNRTSGLYTSRVTREALSANLGQVRYAPCLFQELIPKSADIRVTVIGDRVFACRIDSQADEATALDWRRYHKVDAVHTAARLPDSVADCVVRLINELGLVFGCVDLVHTPDDRYVFLENNPNGQWHGEELRTGLPLLAHFTEMLIQGRPDYADPRG